MNLQTKETIRSVVAIMAGYLTMALVVMLMFLILGIIFPKAFPASDTLPSMPWVVFILTWNGLAAVTGAYVTSLICRGSRTKHVFGLLAVVIVLGLLFLAGNVNKQPLWYLAAQIVTGVIGVLVGGSVPVWGRTSHKA